MLRTTSEESEVLDDAASSNFVAVLAGHRGLALEDQFHVERIFTHHLLNRVVHYVAADFYTPVEPTHSIKSFCMLSLSQKGSPFLMKKLIFTEDDLKSQLGFQMSRGRLDSRLNCALTLGHLLDRLSVFATGFYRRLALTTET